MSDLTREQLLAGIQELRAILAPAPSVTHLKCEGCQWEWGEAVQICENLLAGKAHDDHWETIYEQEPTRK